MDKDNKSEYIQDIKSEYEELRKEYYDSQKDKTYVSLAKARSKALQTDWNLVNIVKPKVLGTKVYKQYDIKKLIPYIDWDPFFSVW